MQKIPLTSLRGIGPSRAEILKTEAGIETVEDLLYYTPRRYVDRSCLKKICNCIPDEEITVSGTVTDIAIAGRSKKFLKVILDDGTGSIDGIFFGGIKYFQKIFNPGESVLFSGKIGKYRNLQIVHPEFDVIDDPSSAINTGRIVPLYRSTEKLRSNYFDSRGFRKIMKQATDEYLHLAAETFESDLLRRYNLPELSDALRLIHFPETFDQAEQARKRLAFNEFFFLLFYINLSRRYIRENTVKKKFELCMDDVTEFKDALPFSLTDDQQRCVEEILSDIQSPYPMNRLLQGDVGSGKTVVAIISIIAIAKAGYQVALMAPTEVLAVQHYNTFLKLADNRLTFRLLTGNTSASEKARVADELLNGDISCVIGTHSLLEDDVKFDNLRLIIIDEQHRFGVEQRAKLRRKGEDTDLLVMTATPIPRSLTMTLYGDLDVSLIRTKPSDRKSIKTLAFPVERLSGVYNSIRKYVNEGRQIYYVLPLIEESEKIDLKSATEVFNNLSQNIFPDLRVNMLHGKLKQREKDSVMNDFFQHRIDILVSTTVIEVGIDVPNASVMVIEHPERFGLSQLHQLRGRVGRGSHQSFCVLVYQDNLKDGSINRIKTMTETDDGFIIAEEDLKQRGSGNIIGIKQHGHAGDFEFADLAIDSDLIANARTEAKLFVEKINDMSLAFENFKSRNYLPLLQGIRKKRILSLLS